MTLTGTATLNPTRRVGNLRAVANAFPDNWDWTRGLDVDGSGCLAPARVGPCAVGAADSQRPSGFEKWVPAYVRQIVECSSLSRLDVGEYARSAGDVTVDYALGLELFDGQATENNPSLADAEVVGEIAGEADETATVRAAIACLEKNIATGLSGRIGLIHVPFGLSIFLPDNVWRDGSGLLRTPAGNLIVVSPGYSGTSLYATGEIWAGSQRDQTRTFTDRADNTDRAWDDQLVLAVFDACFNVEVTTDIVECTPPS